MQTRIHQLTADSLGTSRTLQSLHFGGAEGAPKAYLQASLHADELPAMLVLHHLRQLLEAAEVAGQLLGEIVLVPIANPIGLSQSILHSPMGRFELLSGGNFNRAYPDLLSMLPDDLEERLGASEAGNRELIRECLRAALVAREPSTELESQKLILMRLAFDADVVLDLHCDCEALMHLYTETPYWVQAEPLARYLGARVSLTAQGSGGDSFDETLSSVWWRLAERLAAGKGPRRPIPLACLSATVEYRGMADVDHATARADAAALFAFLQHRGLIAGEPPPMPALAAAPTPLAGSESVRAPHAGVIVFHRKPGDWIEPGEIVAEVIDVQQNQVTPVAASVRGLLYARCHLRYTLRHGDLCRIAGATAFRTGPLLSP